MSKLIKSNQVKIGDEKLIIPSAITIPADEYIGMHPKGMPSHLLGDYNLGDEANDDFEDMQWSDHGDGGHQDMTPEAIAQGIIDQAQVEADQIYENARASAHAIESDALDQVKTLYERTYQEAYQQGHQDGMQAGRDAVAQTLAEALDLKAQWQGRRESVIGDLEAQAIDLVLKTLEKILGEVSQAPTYIEAVLNKGFQKIAYADTLEVRVCERDIDHAKGLREKALAMSENVEDVQFKVDYSLMPGQVIIESTKGSVDVSLQTQFEKVKTLFESLLERDTYAG